jgi:phage terminase large subunit
MGVNLPNGWRPRHYQAALWLALQAGIKRAIYTWHRRAGKDDVALHWTARSLIQRPGTYWYMLPQASQSRKAVWDAIDPHTGRRRIDTAFPSEIREVTRENEMLIKFKNGSTWQVIGSDNYDSLVGSPPVGCVFSEWALSNPAAWSYLRPILAENGGWALFNFTPRGRNHAVTMFEAHTHDPDWFVEKLQAPQTGVFTANQLATELSELQAENGDDDGEAIFRQEYHCDFDSPIVGSYYAGQLAKMDAEHFGEYEYDPAVPVETASDIGRTDDLACIFFQKHHLRIHVIDCEIEAGKDVTWFAKLLQDKPYVYRVGGEVNHGPHVLPWDAVPKTFASPRSVIQQLAGFGVRTRIAPNLDVQDGIQALRAILPRMFFNVGGATPTAAQKRVRKLVDALRNYQRLWDDERKVFKKIPLHNWASHPADAARYLALSYTEDNPNVKPSVFRPPTMNEAWEGPIQSGEVRL